MIHRWKNSVISRNMKNFIMTKNRKTPRQEKLITHNKKNSVMTHTHSRKNSVITHNKNSVITHSRKNSGTHNM